MSTVKLEIFSTFCFLKELQHKQNTLTGYSCFWGNILGNRMNLCPEISENSLTKSKQHLVLQQEKKKRGGGDGGEEINNIELLPLVVIIFIKEHCQHTLDK